MILVSGYPVLIAGNSPQHGCAISGCRFPDITVNISHWVSCGRTGGWTYDHVTTKISWMDTSPLPNFLRYGVPLARASRVRGASLKIHLRSVATYWWFCLTHKWLLRRAVQEFGTKTRVWSCRYTEVLVITPNPNHAHLQTVWQPCLVVAGFQKIAGVLDQSETGNFVG